MRTHMLLLRPALLCFILGFANAPDSRSLPRPQQEQQEQQQFKQSPEVAEAYKVCEQFERLLGENLDFSRAYEATFTKNSARRRAIAIADGEFGGQDLSKLDDELLIKAYKLRVQTLYLMLPLTSPDSEEEAALFFPPGIKEIIQRQAPREALAFPAYVSQLERDVARFRAHLEQLAARYPFVAERVSKFKSEALKSSFEPPSDYKVEPSRGYYRSGVLSQDETYYEINGYIVAREQGRMRIVGIRFFNRLF